MKTDKVTDTDFARSVWAVPPLALDADGGLNHSANHTLAAHAEAGGISTILWGGNANIYAMTETEFADMAAAIPDWAGEGTWAIPSAGPDHGKLRAHADALRGRGYPAAMLLPYTGPGDPAGTETAIRAFTDRAGIPAILYIKRADYLPAERIAALMDGGHVTAIKYAVESDDLSVDPFLGRLLGMIDRKRVVSGIGEIAAIPHLSTFGLAANTAGAVCIAPRRAMAVLRALQSGKPDDARAHAAPIQPLEDLRNTKGQIRVLHEAVTASGIADMGPLGPHFGPLDEGTRGAIAQAARDLLAAEEALARAA